jgi:hypothetical protein
MLRRKFAFDSTSSQEEELRDNKKSQQQKFQESHNQMARVRSTARVDREGDETEATETVPIFEAMKRSGLVTSEDVPAAEAEQADVEETESEDDYSSAVPSKPSHLDFGKSTISEGDLPKMLKLGYFNEEKKELVRFVGRKLLRSQEKNEVVVFKSLFKAGLRFPLNKMIANVLKKFGIYFHQLTPNTIVRLSIYIWALRSQGVEPFAEGFCRVHELHYQTKARGDGLHENFGCYNFAYRKTTKFPVISYRSKWPAGWKPEWLYVKVDDDKEKLVQSPLELIFGETRPPCNMTPEGPTQIALAEFRVNPEHIGIRDLVQEFLAFKVFPTMKEWAMPKLEGKKKEGELIRLPYHYKFKRHFKVPCQEWLDTIEVMCNEILGNYSKKEDQLMTAAFGTRPKRKLNRVMDAIGFEYPDYERLDKGAEGQKRKRVASALNKDDEDQPKKKKQESEAKIVAPKKRKASTPKQKPIDEKERTSMTSSTTEIEEILKVMTETLPVKLSPLGLHLTKLFQKEKELTKTKAPRPKRQRIVTMTEVIEATPPGASAPKIPAIEGMTTTEVVPSEAAAEEARAEDAKSEDINLESIVADIDKMLLNMAAEEAAAEEAAAATKETTTAKPEKEEMTEDTSEDEAFNFQNLVGQELTKAEKEELKEYAISCGYRLGALLFGDIDDERLGCIRDQTGAKVIGTLSKSIGFPKLEADISRYRRQHIVGSLFYSNFKVNSFCLTFIIYNNINVF